MNSIKRAFWSLRHRRGRSVIHILILWILFVSITAAWIVRDSVQNRIAQLGMQTGATVSIKKHGVKWVGDHTESFFPYELAVELGKEAAVETYSCYLSTYAKGVNVSGNMENGPSDPDGDAVVQGDLIVVGVDDLGAYSEFSDEQRKISSGRGFDRSDAECVVVSERFLDANRLELGDSVVIQSVFDTDRVLTLRIVGTHTADSPDINGFISDSNIFYVPVKSAAELGQGGIFMAEYKMKSVSMVEDFTDKIEQLSGENGVQLDILKDTSEYMIGVIPFEGTEKLCEGVLWSLAVLAGTVQIMLIIYSIIERKKETGILYALGEKKRNICLQMLVEEELMILAGGLAGTVVFSALYLCGVFSDLSFAARVMGKLLLGLGLYTAAVVVTSEKTVFQNTIKNLLYSGEFGEK